MSVNENMAMSMVDSTHRMKWEITKEEFDNCDFPKGMSSPTYAIDINGEKSEWYIYVSPKGSKEGNKNKVKISLMKKKSEGKIYKVKYQFGIETQDGHWPEDIFKKLYSRKPLSRGSGWFGLAGYTSDGARVYEGRGYSLGTNEEFKKHFVDNKVTVVAFFVIYAEGDKHLDHMNVADDFVAKMRSMSSFKNLSDFTLISRNIRFPCHRVLLATSSKYFEALFRNEPSRKETEMDESPEVVKTMLNYMYNGLIPNDIDEKALDLILMSDKYALDLLTMACETSLVNNLSADNAVETLITIDKIKHVSKQEHRKKVLTFIKKEADLVVKTQDWNRFVQTYPDIITEILLLK